MTDLSKTIAPKSDQLNADDLIGGPITINVRDVQGKDDPQQPISIFYDGDNGKPYKPCKSMRRVLVSVWGKDGKAYAGRAMSLYCDPKVKFGGIEVGGIRISHVSHIEKAHTMALTASKSVRKPYTVQPLQHQAPQTQAPDPEAIVRAIQKATDAAQGGTDAFRAWFNSDEGKEVRHLFKDDQAEMDKIKAIASDADDANKPDDPFDEEERDTGF